MRHLILVAIVFLIVSGAQGCNNKLHPDPAPTRVGADTTPISGVFVASTPTTKTAHWDTLSLTAETNGDLTLVTLTNVNITLVKTTSTITGNPVYYATFDARVQPTGWLTQDKFNGQTDQHLVIDLENDAGGGVDTFEVSGIKVEDCQQRAYDLPQTKQNFENDNYGSDVRVSIEPVGYRWNKC